MVNLDDPKQKFLVGRGYQYQRGGIWIHPDIIHEDGSGPKQWTLHEAYMYEEHGVWVYK
jgi:hypothetical protein